jgi:hypothetical protein
MTAMMRAIAASAKGGMIQDIAAFVSMAMFVTAFAIILTNL